MSEESRLMREDTRFPLQDTPIDDVSDDEIAEIVATHPLEEIGGLCRGARMLRLSRHLVVKYGRKVKQHGHHEMRMMQMVRERTNIRVPAVYRLFSRGEKGFMVMQYIPSVTVTECWDTLSAERKQAVMDTVAGYIGELQGLVAEDDEQLGPPGRTGKLRGELFTAYEAGPFGSVAQMEEWFNKKLRVSIGWKRAPADSGTFTNTMRPLCMAHYDIDGNNLLVDEHGDVWLIDWEYAGVYPHYFDVAVLSSRRHLAFSVAMFKHMQVSEEVMAKIQLLESTEYARQVMGPF